MLRFAGSSRANRAAPSARPATAMATAASGSVHQYGSLDGSRLRTTLSKVRHGRKTTTVAVDRASMCAWVTTRRRTSSPATRMIRKMSSTPTKVPPKAWMNVCSMALVLTRG